VSGNSAEYGGGVITTYEGVTTLANCTVSGNSATEGGGGLLNYGSLTTSLADTIVAGNTAPTGPDGHGNFASQGFNLIGETNGSTGWIGSDLTGTIASPLDPLLAPLGNFGGPTQTMALLPGSPAIGAGNATGAPPTDQRGFGRTGAVDIGAFQSQGSALVVNTTTSGSTSDPGLLDLRQAVNLANVLATSDTITFDSTVFATPQTITLLGTQLELSDTTGTETIAGPAAGVTVSGAGASRVFQVDGGVTASLSGLTITGGSTSGNGGGVYLDNGGTATLTDCTVTGNSGNFGGGLANYAGMLTLSGCTVSGNTASTSGGGVSSPGRGSTTTMTYCTVSGNFATSGGGVYDGLRDTLVLTNCTISGNSTIGVVGTGGGGVTTSGDTDTMTNCTISNNSSNGEGGGFFINNGHSFSTTLTNCTISGNTSGNAGGGLMNYGNLTLFNCTLSRNTASGEGGGLYIDYGPTSPHPVVTFGNTIVAGNSTGTSGPDVFGSVVSQGNNLIGKTDGSSGWVASDLTGTIASPLDPLLASLAYYGGPTQTMALLPGSPAIGGGMSTGTPPTDQRGAPRGSVVDIGAFQTSLVVESASGSVDTTTASLTLPGAVTIANEFAGSTITFDPAIFDTGQTITLTAPLALGNTVLSTTIAGPGAGVIVSGGNAVGVFQVESGVTATLSGLTISDGHTTGNGGGLDNEGAATVSDCTLSASTAQNGGGVYTAPGAVTTLIDSTVSGDKASHNGGGLYNAGVTTLTNCTLSGDTAMQNGGGLATGSGGMTTLTNCTVSGNSATNGGGLSSAGGTVILGNTLVAGNTATSSGPDVFGTFASAGFNLIGETDGSSGWVGSDLTGTIAQPLDPLLGPLADNGGPTQTMALLTGSPAIDAGSNSIPGLTIPTTDQRGAVRGPAGLNAGATVDIGAYEASSSYLVTSTADSDDVGAFRAAVGWANVSTNANPASIASPAPNTIDFDSAGLFATAQTITLSASLGALEFSNTTTAESINGPAAGVSISGGNAVRVFQVDDGVTATLSGLTITEGYTTGDGGGLYNDGGIVTLTAVTLTANVAAVAGGGLFNTRRGTVTITPCTVSGNSAASGGGLYNYYGTIDLNGVTVAGNSAMVAGGGLFNARRGTITITPCGVSGNSASAGGGLYNAGGTATLTGVTVAANTAVVAGGGLFNARRGTVTITTCTVSGNSGAGGGGLYNLGTASLIATTIAGNSATVGGGIDNETGGSATLENTIVAANTDSGTPSDIGGGNAAGVTGSYDLVGTGGSGGLAGGTGNIILTNLASLGLGALGYYGGPTETIPLLPGSAAIGTGTTIPGISTDQRGLSPSGATPDIGAFQSQGFTLSVVAGSTPQGAGTGIAFANPLAVTATPNDPLEPVAGGVVNFSVNPASNGASANLSAATAIIGSNGIAEVTATANSTIGSYTVSASAIGTTSSVNFALTNDVVLTFSGIVSQSILYDTASVTFTGTLASGARTPQGENVAVTLDGVTQEAAIGSSGAFSTTFDSSGLAASTTPYTVSYVYASDGTFAGASTTSSLSITKATPAINWADPAAIVFGTALSSTQLDATASVPGNVIFTPAPGTILDAGTDQTLSVTFTPTDTTDYTTASASVTINVGQATPTITWANPAQITFGTALSAAQLDATAGWTVGGVNGNVAGTFTYTPAAGTVLSAGTGQALSVTFTPTDTTDYTDASASVTINVGQATPTITWANPAQITYGTALSAAQLDATAAWTVGGASGTVAGSFTYTSAAGTVLNAGTGQTLSVTFTPTNTTDFSTASSTVTINVQKATPTITWTDPADIIYGTALSAAQLDATAAWTVGGVNGAIAGSFTYTPAAGTVLHAGAGQALSVTFTPTDTTDFSTASASVTLDVQQATPDINWTAPAAITFGTALSAAQLDAAAAWTVGEVNGAVAGSFTYTPAAGTVLKPGIGQTLSVTFTPTDTTDFSTASASVTLDVQKITPDINWTAPAEITFGTALSAAQLDAKLVGADEALPGSFTYTPAAGTVLSAGAGQTLSVTFTPAITTDYSTASASVTINVQKATPTITWASPTDITYGTALSVAQLDATADATVGEVKGSVAGTFTYTQAAGTVLSAGAGQTLSVTFTPTDTIDFSNASASVTINVDQATPDITWTAPAAITYGTALSAAQLDATAAWTVGAASGAVAGSFSYTPAAGTVVDTGNRQALSVTFTPTDAIDFSAASDTVTIDVDKVVPTIAWANPPDITYGTALSAAQLDATASVPGTFVYAPGVGTILHAGSNQGLSATFTPADTTDFSTASASVIINVQKATPDLTWTAPAAIPFGTALSASQLDATPSWTVGDVAGSVAGTFTYDPAAGTVLPVGTGQTLSVAFAPSDSPDFNSASATETVSVVPSADLSVKVAAPATVIAGQDLVYTVTATNNGPSTATGVVVTDTLPPSPTDVNFVRASTSVTAGPSGTITFNPVSLASGDSISYSITVAATAAAALGSPLLDTADVAGNQFDPNLSNNTAQASVTVSLPVDLAITRFTDAASAVQNRPTGSSS
jgi:uncharacterized repeat protein (TIGR01451 family)